MKKIIIAGSRGFNNYEFLCNVVDAIIVDNYVDDKIVIISGGARGADKLGEKYANEKEYELLVFPAEWDKFGKRAGYVRNEQMALNADVLVAFWDGTSRGTKHMIDLAKKNGLEVFEIKY